MSKYERKERPFNLEEWELGMFRACVGVGHWHDVAFLFPRVGQLVPENVLKVLLAGARRKGPKMEDVELSKSTHELLEARAKEGCVSCQFIVDDWKTNNKLTDYGNFPAEAKVSHIEAEKAGQVA